jgi:hypothetical protein
MSTRASGFELVLLSVGVFALRACFGDSRSLTSDLTPRHLIELALPVGAAIFFTLGYRTRLRRVGH